MINKIISEEVKKKLKLQVCESSCWCEFCARTIHKGDNYFRINKSAWKGTTRINICLPCLDFLCSLIDKKELKKLNERRLIDNL